LLWDRQEPKDERPYALRVLEFLATKGSKGASASQIEAETAKRGCRINRQTAEKVFHRFEEKGFAVRDSGEQGRHHAIYKLTSSGQKLFESLGSKGEIPQTEDLLNTARELTLMGRSKITVPAVITAGGGEFIVNAPKKLFHFGTAIQCLVGISVTTRPEVSVTPSQFGVSSDGIGGTITARAGTTASVTIVAYGY
jgi:DNA-binding PadR family transcriptional regulator